MSPRLLYILATRHLTTHGRDRIDRQLATEKYSPRHAPIHAPRRLPA